MEGKWFRHGSSFRQALGAAAESLGNRNPRFSSYFMAIQVIPAALVMFSSRLMRTSGAEKDSRKEKCVKKKRSNGQS